MIILKNDFIINLKRTFKIKEPSYFLSNFDISLVYSSFCYHKFKSHLRYVSDNYQFDIKFYDISIEFYNVQLLLFILFILFNRFVWSMFFYWIDFYIKRFFWDEIKRQNINIVQYSEYFSLVTKNKIWQRIFKSIYIRFYISPFQPEMEIIDTFWSFEIVFCVWKLLQEIIIQSRLKIVIS